ncbi:MAG: hypothetical protein HGA87_06845 [Desulfobulbaceae bacterium]|nr:hypothetical protein [Desulfobulbaceae bacterium]
MTLEIHTPSFYARVENLVQSGKLRIIHIDAPPRTISSAFQIALTEGGCGHLYEPFRQYSSRAKQAITPVCQDILSQFEKAQKECSSHKITKHGPHEPTTIFVKELAQFIGDADFKQWHPLIGGWVSMVRSPNIQVQSFLTRSILNGHHFSKEQIAEAKKHLSQELGKEPSEYEVVYNLSERFRVKGKKNSLSLYLPHKLETPLFDMWGALSRHFAQITSSDIPKVIVDGTVLCTKPEWVMNVVSSTLSIPFNRTMLSGWSSASGGNLIPDMKKDELKTDAWLADAVKSRSFCLPQNQPLPLAMFTPSVRIFTEQALGVFVDLCTNKHAVLPRQPEEVEALYAVSVPSGSPFGTNIITSNRKNTFKNNQPIIAYAIALGMSPGKERDKHLSEIESIHADGFSDSFEVMRNRQQNFVPQQRVASL